MTPIIFENEYLQQLAVKTKFVGWRVQEVKRDGKEMRRSSSLDHLQYQLQVLITKQFNRIVKYSKTV